jgi:hypothetical protein
MRDWPQFIRQHLPPLAVGPERESEIVAELALQMEQAYSEALAGGVTEGEALRRAQAQFPDWNKLARDIDREERPEPCGKRPMEPAARGAWFGGSLHDIRYALRCLRKNPGFAAISVLTLAFGIGGNTAIFTMVDALALRSLPYREPDRLVAIETRKTQQPELEAWTSALDFFDAREQTRSFTAMAAISPIWNVVLTGRGTAERLECLFVSAEVFPMLGVTSAVGRLFVPAEDKRAQPSPVVVISHALWQRRFSGSREAIGQSLNLDNSAYTVIGVMPPDFRFLGEPVAGTASQIDAWFPLSDNPLTGSIRGLRFLKAIGRLKPGVSAAHAGDEVRRFGAALAHQYPESNRGFFMEHAAAEPAGFGTHPPHHAAAVGRGGLRAADGVRQRGQSAAGQSRGAPAGNLGADRAGRRVGPSVAATADRRLGIGGPRRGGRASSGLLRAAVAGGQRAGQPGA